MENVIVVLILLVVVAAVLLYLVRAKKREETCIGCPYANKCGCHEVHLCEGHGCQDIDVN